MKRLLVIYSQLFYILLLCLLGVFVLGETYARGDILTPWRYLKNYNLGFDVGDTNDHANIEFDHDNPDDCHEYSSKQGRCEIKYTKRSTGFGIFLQQPLKYKGLWHIDWDIGINARILDSKLVAEELENREQSDLPVNDLRVHLYALVIRPYITFGITPKGFFPDILISMGPVGEGLWGSVVVNNERYQVPESGNFRRSHLLNPFGAAELEMVFRRFGKGYFGLTYWFSNGLDDVENESILPDEIGGVSNPRLTFQKNFLGFKLLLK